MRRAWEVHLPSSRHRLPPLRTHIARRGDPHCDWATWTRSPRLLHPHSTSTRRRGGRRCPTSFLTLTPPTYSAQNTGRQIGRRYRLISSTPRMIQDCMCSGQNESATHSKEEMD